MTLSNCSIAAALLVELVVLGVRSDLVVASLDVEAVMVVVLCPVVEVLSFCNSISVPFCINKG
jgi:hypothetical protein